MIVIGDSAIDTINYIEIQSIQYVVNNIYRLSNANTNKDLVASIGASSGATELCLDVMFL